MKKTLIQLLVLLGVLTGLASCNSSTTVRDVDYTPTWWYSCFPQYDYMGNYLFTNCSWQYYNNDGSIAERDMVSNVADEEAFLLEKLTSVYADKFSLSTQAAGKLAKNIADFSALTERSNADLADFAQKLYGVNPSEIISAVSAAQIGDNSALDSVIDKASLSLGTNSDTMRAIVKELHGKALEASGIEL
jgi:hypothetical protein